MTELIVLYSFYIPNQYVKPATLNLQILVLYTDCEVDGAISLLALYAVGIAWERTIKLLLGPTSEDESGSTEDTNERCNQMALRNMPPVGDSC